MTGKADFTPEEWELLREAPPAAGMLVLTQLQVGGGYWSLLAENRDAILHGDTINRAEIIRCGKEANDDGDPPLSEDIVRAT